MNETLKTIMERRSIKGYLPNKKVADADLKMILDAAICAPNALNKQLWHFTVVQDQAMIDKINATIKETMLNDTNPVMAERAKNPDYNPLYGASTLVIVTAEENAPAKEVTCGAAAENIALAAAALGVDSCLVGGVRAVFNCGDAAAFRKDLGIPENYVFVISVLLGYRAIPPAQYEKKTDVVNYVK